jgi:hypothetical protein
MTEEHFDKLLLCFLNEISPNDLLGPTDLLREKSLDSRPSVAVCSGPEFVEAGAAFETGV